MSDAAARQPGAPWDDTTLTSLNLFGECVELLDVPMPMILWGWLLRHIEILVLAGKRGSVFEWIAFGVTPLGICRQKNR